MLGTQTVIQVVAETPRTSIQLVAEILTVPKMAFQAMKMTVEMKMAGQVAVQMLAMGWGKMKMMSSLMMILMMVIMAVIMALVSKYPPSNFFTNTPALQFLHYIVLHYLYCFAVLHHLHSFAFILGARSFTYRMQ